jgi:hypothetical protein
MRLNRFATTLLSLLTPMFAVVASAQAQNVSQNSFKAESFQSNVNVRLESTKISGHFADRLLINGAEFGIISAEPSDTGEAQAFEALSPNVQNELQSARREVITASVKAILSGRLTGPAMMQGDRGVVISLSDDYLRGKKITTVEPTQAARANPSKLVQFAKMASEAVFTSTLLSAKNYGKASSEMSGNVIEAGISLNFKIELSLGLGGLNFSKNAGLLIEIGYNHKTHQVVFHYAQRKEKQSGGVSSPSVKAEIRLYQMTDHEELHSEFAGKSWYPPAIPLISAVLDSGGPYRAQGLVFGFTAGDWVGLSVVNTENDYDEVQETKVLMTVSGPVDAVLMTVFKAVWIPVKTAAKLVYIPTKAAATAVAPHAKNVTQLIRTQTSSAMRSCQAFLSRN